MAAASTRAPRSAWIAWATVCVIWGTTYFAIKIALESIPPFLMGGIRYVIAGGGLIAWIVARGRPLPARAHWGRLALLGFLMVFMGNGGVVWAEQHIPTGLTAVLIAMSPFWMVGVDALFRDGRQLFLRQWIGLLIGFTGIVVLVWPDIAARGLEGGLFAAGVLSVQLACAGWAVGSAYTRRHVMPGDVLGSAAIQMFAGGVFMGIVGSLLGEWSELAFTPRSTVAFWYLVVAGSVVAYAAYSYALQHLDIAIVSLYTYVNPVIALALGTLVLGEPFHLRMIAGAAVIVIGVLVVGTPRRG